MAQLPHDYKNNKDIINSAPFHEHSTSNLSSLRILLKLFTSPQTAFSCLRHKYPVLLPVTLIILFSCLLSYLIISQVDMEWYVELIIQQSGNLTIAEQDAIRQANELLSPTSKGIFAAIMQGIAWLISLSVVSLYLVMVSGIRNDGFEFRQWFSLVSWSFIPSLFGTLASYIAYLMTSNGQYNLEAINPISLNALFFQLDPEESTAAILASVDITVFLTLTLMTLGYANWTETSRTKSFTIISVPFIAFYSISYLMS